MPFSRSRSIESMTRSRTEPSSAWCWEKTPDCQSIASTNVVLPWSTWAMIATLRRSSRVGTTCQATGVADRGGTLTVSTVNISAPDARELADFYLRLLGWELVREEDDWVLLRPPGGGVGIS